MQTRQMMSIARVLGGCVLVLLAAANVGAASSPLADAAEKQNRDAIRSLLRQKADVNAPQVDGTTALHWAVRLNDVLNTLNAIPSKMRILLLDACRNNPFPAINKTTGHGLALVDTKTGIPGTFLSYSTTPGAEAEDTARQDAGDLAETVIFSSC